MHVFVFLLLSFGFCGLTKSNLSVTQVVTNPDWKIYCVMLVNISWDATIEARNLSNFVHNLRPQFASARTRFSFLLLFFDKLNIDFFLCILIMIVICRIGKQSNQLSTSIKWRWFELFCYVLRISGLFENLNKSLSGYCFG